MKRPDANNIIILLYVIGIVFIGMVLLAVINFNSEDQHAVPTHTPVEIKAPPFMRLPTNLPVPSGMTSSTASAVRTAESAVTTAPFQSPSPKDDF